MRAQHIDGHAGGAEFRHPIATEPGSRLASLFGARCVVNSRHHQAVGVLGRGLRVTARCDEGTVEGVEGTGDGGGAYLVCVQWHPEDMIDEAPQMDLFRDFGRACGGT
jgi:putative glutamine amidotransferase